MFKKGLAILLSFVIIFSLFTVLPFQASAAVLGDDYPNRNSCAGCHSTANGDNHNDYNYRAFFYRQCTDFVAWRLNNTNGVYFTNSYGGNPSIKWGNGNHWDDAARALGITVDSNPAIGAVAQTDAGYWGHVAWVADIIGDDVVIEEYNYLYASAYSKRQVSKYSFNYIHIKDINPGPSFTPVDLGTDFYAIILNSHYWKPIENNNHNVVLGTENHTRKQLWKFERQNDLSYKIISLFDNEVIDLNNYGTANGTNIGMCASTDSLAQRWYITNNNGAYCFIPKCSPNGAMDINNNDSTDGTNIHYWAYHGKDSQTFSIYRIDDIAQYLSVDIGSNFTALVLNSHYWKPIENRDHNVVLSTEDYSKKQLWRFERQSDKSYKIISLLDNEVIDLKDFGNANGTNIGMCVSTDSSAQRWYITNNNGAYCLIPKCSQDGAMDINNYDSADGTNIHYWSFHGKDSQTFSIYKISDVNEYLNSHTDPTSIPTETTKLLGDADGNGTVTITDATIIQRYLTGLSVSYPEETLMNADVNNDGILTILDATFIQRHVTMINTPYPIGEPKT